MTDRATSILHQALQLSEGERAEIAARLLHSLDRHRDTEAEQLWGDEIQRRIREEDEGTAKLMTADEALRFIRSSPPEA